MNQKIPFQSWNRCVSAYFACALLLGTSCGKDDSTGSPGSGGASASGGSTGSGGNSGSGGQGSGGSTGSGTGGAKVGSGGATGSGGSTGSGGGAATGGTTGSGGKLGTGGSATASGGATAPGTGGSASGGVKGSGGTTGTGGHAGSTVAGSGGATGNGGSGSSNGGSSGSCPTANEDKFSFFLVSQAEMIRQGGADSTGKFPKYGGNYGGLAGADKICQTAAEHSSACQTGKTWHAFLSTSTADAIDRIGKGPWYDRMGRLWASTIAALLDSSGRPKDADAAIKNNPPNETGTPNENPDGTGNVDNHETITGSGTDGRLYKQTGTTGMSGGSTYCGPDVGASAATWSAMRATCNDWTDDKQEGCPRVGHSWPAAGSGTNWISVWNEAGCAPGGTLSQTGGTVEAGRTIGSAGGYGGYFCYAVINP